MASVRLVAFLASTCVLTVAQPPGGGGGPPPGGAGGPPGGGGGGGGMSNSGETSLPLSACGTTATLCALDGSTANTARYLTYSVSTGIFSGYMLTNQCPSTSKIYTYSGVRVSIQSNPTCVNQTFPAPAYRSTPIAAPLRNRVGLAIRGGENIFGPLDAGFATGSACSVAYGSCDAGTDVTMCEARLEYLCGTSRLTKTMFMDDCGGHASPYHYHCHMKCEANSTVGHSPLTAIMMDGRGLYGMYESTDMMPTDLDACGGHFGTVPATTVGGVTYPAASYVYHYHVQPVAPFLVGCFGPVSSLSQAKALYPTCAANASTISVCTSVGMYSNYTLDCPVYRHGSESMNQATVTAACPVCTGNCSGTYGNSSVRTSGSSTSHTVSVMALALMLAAGALQAMHL